MALQPPDMHGQPGLPRSASGDDLPQQAVALAERLLHTARQEQTSAEQEQAARLARMMADPAGKGTDHCPGGSSLPQPSS